jgi:adenylate kinase
VGGVVALTGTPGTGKSAVARALPRRWRSVEVAELARQLGAARGRSRHVEVDLARVRQRWATGRRSSEFDLVVGHLAHLLPISDVIVLRCHPAELDRRLRTARRGRATERRDNVVTEATDVVLVEALGRARRVWEVDTTGRSVRAVARAVAARLRRRGRSSYGTVDWLADPAVTAHLLDPPR